MNSAQTIIFSFTLACCVGCASYSEQTHMFRGAWNSGNPERAAKLAEGEIGNRKNSRDAVIWLLEQGTALRAAGRFEESNAAFQAAEDLIAVYDQKARVRISRETTGLLSNLTMLPYEGRGYDRVMLNTFQALNHLQLGQAEKAMVELRQAHAAQDAEVIRNARRIVAARKSGGDFQNAIMQTESDPRAQSELKALRPNTELDYGAFINPFTDFLHSLLLWSLDAEDRENALVSLRRIHATLDGQPFFGDELRLVDAILSGADHPDLTYILFETGVAPLRREMVIHLPLMHRDVPYVAAAFPKLDIRDSPQTATVTYNGKEIPAAPLCNIDAVVARDFRTELPIVVARTLAASAVKAAATYAARKNAGDLGVFAGIVYQAVSARADLRTWSSLPKMFYIWRVKTPVDRALAVAINGQQNELVVNKGRVNVVYVKGFARGAPLIISQFRLK